MTALTLNLFNISTNLTKPTIVSFLASYQLLNVIFPPIKTYDLDVSRSGAESEISREGKCFIRVYD